MQIRGMKTHKKEINCTILIIIIFESMNIALIVHFSKPRPQTLRGGQARGAGAICSVVVVAVIWRYRLKYKVS